MNTTNALRRSLLAVTAASGRTVTLPRPTPAVLPPRIAFGSEQPVLVVGSLPTAASDSFASHRDVTIVDNPSARAARSIETLRAQGCSDSRVLNAAPENLKLDLDIAEERWHGRKPSTFAENRALLRAVTAEAYRAPAVADQQFSIVYCTLLNECADDNLRADVLREVHRVTRDGGVARFYVDLADTPAATGLLGDQHFSAALAALGFHGIRVAWRSTRPASLTAGLELYACVIDAWRGKVGPCLDQGQSILYRGPWSKVFDDDGHVFERDRRTPVCAKTFRLLSGAPYAADVIPLESSPSPPQAGTTPAECTTEGCC